MLSRLKVFRTVWEYLLWYSSIANFEKKEKKDTEKKLLPNYTSHLDVLIHLRIRLLKNLREFSVGNMKKTTTSQHP